MLSQYLQSFFTLLIVVDPLGLVPLFIAATGSLDQREKLRTMHLAVIVSFIIMSFFALLGRYILSFFGIEPGAFYIAGGVMFFLISLEMLFGQPKRSKSSDQEEQADSSSLAVFPLAIPMISGPGTVTTVMLYSASGTSWLSATLLQLAAIIPVLLIAWLAMRGSGMLLRVLGKTGVSVLERMMGLILSGLSVQFILDGLAKLGIL